MGSYWSYFSGGGDQDPRSRTREAVQRQKEHSAPIENLDYDPHAHRYVRKPTNNAETLIHLVKCSLGTGILAMPQGLARGGLVVGIIAMLIICFIIAHCVHVLVGAQYAACRRVRKPILTYTEAIKVAIRAGPKRFAWFAQPAGTLVDIFLIVHELGTCCTYIIFMATSFKYMVDPYYFITTEGWIGIVFVPLIFINLIPDLKILVPFSCAGNLLTFLGLIIAVHYLLVGIKGDATLDLVGPGDTFPLFFGTVMFSLSSPGVVLAIENNMSTPKSFSGIFGLFNISMVFIVVLYIVIGGMGYAYCISKCSDSFTYDLPKGTAHIFVTIFMVLAVFTSYVLHCYVPVKVIWRGYLLPWLEESNWLLHLKFWEYLLRTTLTIITFIVSIAIPRLGLFISLFGAFCLSATGVCFPALMEACLAYSRRQEMLLVIIKDVILIILGLIGLVAGTYAAVIGILKSFGHV